MKRFKAILCVIELGEDAKSILDRAVALARNNQASLKVVAVPNPEITGFALPVDASSPANLQQALLQQQIQSLDALIDPYRARAEIETEVLVGVPFLEIIREVIRNGHDLVMKVPEHLEWLDRLFGSDDMHLLRKCPCPVWLIKKEQAGSHRRIVAAVDVGGDYSPAQLKIRHYLDLLVLEVASSLALSENAELHIVHVWESVGESLMRGGLVNKPKVQIDAYVEQVRMQHSADMNRLISEVIENLGQEAFNFLQPQTHLRKGWARKEVPAFAEEIGADLLVMGTVARTGIPGLIIGNTAETILGQLKCSVLALKPPGFVTPVKLEG